MSKKHVYRKGDVVRVVNFRPIKRVGYPLYAPDLYAEFEDHPKLVEALQLLGVVGPKQTLAGWAKRDAVHGLARAAVRARGWGGPERSIHYYGVVQPGDNLDRLVDTGDSRYDATGRTATVLDRRVRQTGTYFSPSYYGEDYWEPGGLSDMKAHVILTTTLGDFEACDVELVVEPTDA